MTNQETYTPPEFQLRPTGRITRRYALVLIVCVLVLSGLWGVMNSTGAFITPPSSVTETGEFFSWYLGSVVTAHLLYYAVGFLVAYILLPVTTWSYFVWLFKQYWMQVLVRFVLAESLVLVAMGLLFFGASDHSMNQPGTTGFTGLQTNVWSVAMYTPIFFLWWGYRTGWVSYRVLGASTQDMLYEEDMEDLRRDTTGRWWEKYPEKYWNMLWALKRKRPRRGFIMCMIILPMLSTLGHATGQYYMSFSLSAGLSFMFTCITLIILAMLQKNWDFSLNTRCLPVLNVMRWAGHDVAYDPLQATVTPYKPEEVS